MIVSSLPTPQMLALESKLEALGDWRAQLDQELQQYAEETCRINKLAGNANAGR